ncbi:anti-repressor SinI family protein [Salipaludibacillus sp. HK11]
MAEKSLQNEMEWHALMVEAKRMGLSVEEVRAFLKR